MPRPQPRYHRKSLASLLAILLMGPTAWPRAAELTLGDLPLKGTAPRVRVAVHQGRLSVDLWEADLGEVLAQIQQQAGIAIRVSPSPAHTVSVQFTDVALDQGLRRLLQLASRSYAMGYVPGPTGEVALQEVQVFAEAPAWDQRPAEAVSAAEQPEVEVGQRVVDVLVQRHATAPAVAREDDSDAASYFREALERHAAPAPRWTDAPEHDAARRFRDALEDFTGTAQR